MPSLLAVGSPMVNLSSKVCLEKPLEELVLGKEGGSTETLVEEIQSARGSEDLVSGIGLWVMLRQSRRLCSWVQPDRGTPASISW